MNNVIPGILEKEWSEIERKLELAKQFAKAIHIDIIDGKFADNLTFLDPQPFKKYSNDFFFELHMMVENPIEYVKPWADAGFKRFLGHIELMPHQENFLNEARKYGEAGLAIDGPTDPLTLNALPESSETILFMSIKAGFSGQEFNPSFLEKIKQIKEKGFTGTCEVDGGINDQTLITAKECGANRFVSTSYLFNSENPQITFQNLKSKQ
jgi:ribulose-phosphate 3-epimerase